MSDDDSSDRSDGMDADKCFTGGTSDLEATEYPLRFK